MYTEPLQGVYMRIFAAIALLVTASSAQALDVTQPPYNVVCDGVTDNTGGLQAALDSFCPSGKGEIELPKTGAYNGGTYGGNTFAGYVE
jgi:hypothetical protein